MAITLNNGFKMPIIGLGVWRMEGKEIRDLITNSIKLGYRHFDCAGTSFPYPFLFLVAYFLGSWLNHHSFESVLAFLGS
jgi:hypothetical protein